jgi:serine/threonine protein kinase
MLNPSLRYTSPEFTIKSISIKDIRNNDIWKTGVMVLALLSGEDLSKDLLAL